MAKIDSLSSYEIEALGEIRRGGEIVCRECGEDINVLKGHTREQMRGGVEFTCPYCSEMLVDINEYQTNRFIEYLDTDITPAQIDRVMNLIGNIMTDDEVEKALEELDKMKKAIRARS